jgi:hypothetical protein
MRAATLFSGGHADDVDYISWNPTHPDLFCTSSQKDRKIVFWDARRNVSKQIGLFSVELILFISLRKSTHATMRTEDFAGSNKLCPRRALVTLCVCRASVVLHDAR